MRTRLEVCIFTVNSVRIFACCKRHTVAYVLRANQRFQSRKISSVNDCRETDACRAVQTDACAVEHRKINNYFFQYDIIRQDNGIAYCVEFTVYLITNQNIVAFIQIFQSIAVTTCYYVAAYRNRVCVNRYREGSRLIANRCRNDNVTAERICYGYKLAVDNRCNRIVVARKRNVCYSRCAVKVSNVYVINQVQFFTCFHRYGFIFCRNALYVAVLVVVKFQAHRKVTIALTAETSVYIVVTKVKIQFTVSRKAKVSKTIRLLKVASSTSYTTVRREIVCGRTNFISLVIWFFLFNILFKYVVKRKNQLRFRKFKFCFDKSRGIYRIFAVNILPQIINAIERTRKRTACNTAICNGNAVFRGRVANVIIGFAVTRCSRTFGRNRIPARAVTLRFRSRGICPLLML